ncbi:MAG: alpha-mannosidase [Chloroflexota bacterium]|nr:alpha-mannosidase [Chloroflexota bacterium]
MPQETRDPNAGGPPAHRRELVANTAGLDVDAGRYRVRISNAPLFRQGTGGLLQGIRLRTEATGDGAPIDVSISLDGSELDHISVSTGTVSTEFLFVPEVTAESGHVIDFASGGESLARVPFTVVPQRKWSIHLVHHSHYDIGYTDTQTDVLASQLTFIDDALELVAATDEWPTDAQFRWSIEVNWPLRHWLRTRPKPAIDELVRRVGEGRIEINALPFSMHTEAYSFDELARQFDFTQQMRRELGVEIVTAMQTDVPGATIGLSTLLTDAGIRFLAVAHNYAGRSIPHLLDGQDLTRPFYWQAPDGEKVLVWYTDTLHGSAYMEAMTIGFGDGYDDVLMSLPEYLNALAQRNYPYGSGEDWLSGSLQGVVSSRGSYPYDLLHLRVQGALGDNAPPSLRPSEIVRQWNETWAYPRLMTSTNRAFMEAAEARIGGDLDTFAGDWTDWWADGIGSSAVVLGKNRASQDNIRTAQTLNALAGALGDHLPRTLPGEVTTAYEEMALFDEHTWGASDPWGTDFDRRASGEHQWHRKAGFAYAGEERVNLLLQGGTERLSNLAISNSRVTSGESIAVVNPNSWARTDLVRLFIPDYAWPTAGAALVEVDTGRSIAFTVEPQIHERHRPMGVWLHFLAESVPAFGYTRYILASGTTSIASEPVAERQPHLENDHLAVDIDLEHGTIRSLLDRTNQRELVDEAAPFGFNAYIHDRYTSGTGFNHLSSKMGRAQPWLLGGRGTGSYGLVTSHSINPVYQQLTYRQTAQGADWIETTLTLPHGVPRLHISNRLHKPAVMEKESVYFTFPFAGNDPKLTFEVTGGTVGPDSPHVPGSARHFRAIRHWVTIEQNGQPPVAWATTQAPLIQVGNIHLPYAPFPATIPAHQASSGTIYSWALNNIWDTNFPPQQGGEMRFDYVIATGAAGMAAALGRDTGAVASQPLVGIRARSRDTGVGLADRGSFVSVDDPRVEVTHLAQETGGELVVHLQSHGSDRVTTHMTFAGMAITRAWFASFTGTEVEALPLRDNAVTVTVDAGALNRIRLELSGDWPG